MQKLHYTLIASFAALVMLSAPAHANHGEHTSKLLDERGFCFENENSGARVSFFLYKEGNSPYRPGNHIWRSYQDAVDGNVFCVQVDQLAGIGIGDGVIAGWQVEGKYIGEHSFTCPGVERLNPTTVKSIKFYITGWTVFDTGCRREETWTRHAAYEDTVVAASEVCFRVDNPDEFVLRDRQKPVFALSATGHGARLLWRWNYKTSDKPIRCVKLKDMNVYPNQKMLASISRPAYASCPGRVVTAANSNKKVIFTRVVDEDKRTIKCARSIR